MTGAIILILSIGIAYVLLKAFDRAAGRGSKQVSDGLKDSAPQSDESQRMPCPRCAEKVIRTAKVCRFCGTPLSGGT